MIPPANDAGFDPNRSVLPAGTPRAEREAFAREFLAVRRSEDADPSGAIAGYRELLDRQPGFAETHYRLGVLLAHQGDWDEAYQQFVAARDLDGFPLAARRIPAGLPRRGRHHRDGTILIDGQALFHAIGSHGLLDDELVHDAMHPALRGHIALAQAILEALRRRSLLGWPPNAPAPRIDPSECAAHFGIGREDWRLLAERGAMFYFGMAPLRYDPGAGSPNGTPSCRRPAGSRRASRRSRWACRT